MKRRPGPYRNSARDMISFVAEKLNEREGESRNDLTLAVGIAVTYALLEVAHQVGRVADNVPMWGPEEER